jgi:hypothetical protein
MDDRHQWLGSLQTQDVARGTIEFLLARQGVDSEQFIDRFTMRAAPASAGLSFAASKNALLECALSGAPDKAH